MLCPVIPTNGAMEVLSRDPQRGVPAMMPRPLPVVGPGMYWSPAKLPITTAERQALSALAPHWWLKRCVRIACYDLKY